MKNFLKTLGIGFELMLVSLLSICSLTMAGILLANIHTTNGWMAILVMLAAILGLAFGILFMWCLGTIGLQAIEYSKAEEELKNDGAENA